MYRYLQNMTFSTHKIHMEKNGFEVLLLYHIKDAFYVHLEIDTILEACHNYNGKFENFSAHEMSTTQMS